MNSPQKDMLQFSETEETTIDFTQPDSLVDTVFAFIDKNINPGIKELGSMFSISDQAIKKDSISSLLDKVKPTLNIDLTCVGGCEKFDTIKIAQQNQFVTGVKKFGFKIPVVNTSVSLSIEPKVTVAARKVITPCVSVESIKADQAQERFAEAMREFNSKKAKGENPKAPKIPLPAKNRTVAGRQVQQDFVIKWVLTIQFSLLQTESALILYKQTINRYSPCCPLPLISEPKDKGAGEGDEDESLVFFDNELGEIEGISETILDALASDGIEKFSQLANANVKDLKVKGVSAARLKNYFIPAASLFVELKEEIDSGELNRQDIEVLAKVYQGDLKAASQDSVKDITANISQNRVKLGAGYSPDRLQMFLKRRSF